MSEWRVLSVTEGGVVVHRVACCGGVFQGLLHCSLGPLANETQRPGCGVSYPHRPQLVHVCGGLHDACMVHLHVHTVAMQLPAVVSAVTTCKRKVTRPLQSWLCGTDKVLRVLLRVLLLLLPLAVWVLLQGSRPRAAGQAGHTGVKAAGVRPQSAASTGVREGGREGGGLWSLKTVCM